MKSLLHRIKDKLGPKDDFDLPDDESYVQLTTEGNDSRSKIVLRPFILEDFSDVKNILESLREGYTIGLINIKPLKDKDIVELKRAINKLKKTTDAIDGDIAGFGDDWVAVVPSFATIFREPQSGSINSNNSSSDDDY